jgi:hypothetical protein
MLLGKGLTVNVLKSYIINCSFYFLFLHSGAPREISYIYLGMLFDKHVNLHYAASHALRPLNAAIRRVKQFNIDKRTGLMLCCVLLRHMRCQLACMPVDSVHATS